MGQCPAACQEDADVKQSVSEINASSANVLAVSAAKFNPLPPQWQNARHPRKFSDVTLDACDDTFCKGDGTTESTSVSNTLGKRRDGSLSTLGTLSTTGTEESAAFKNVSTQDCGMILGNTQSTDVVLGLQISGSKSLHSNTKHARSIGKRCTALPTGITEVTEYSVGIKRLRTEHLRTTVPAGLLRGVGLQDAMRMFGQHWGSSPLDPDAGAADLPFALDVDGYQDFISHDWSTPRSTKFLTICFAYNLRPALLVSTMWAILAGILTTRQVGAFPVYDQEGILLIGGKNHKLPHGCLATLIAPVLFFLCFFFWQRIRRAFARPSIIVFFDKLCVNQVDEEEKKGAVLSLAGFLSVSSRMLILWSPRYFTRLWCTYELASWLHLGKSLSSGVEFIPVEMAYCLLAVLSLAVLLTIAHVVIMKVNSSLSNGTLFFVASVVARLMCGLVVVHRMRRMVREMELLPLQLSYFSIRDAKCFCCTNCHVHPATGMSMACDRQMVYEQLKQWFVNADVSDPTAHLDAFNDAVRYEFGPHVCRTAGGSKVKYEWTMILTLPYIWYYADVIPAMAELEFNEQAIHILHVLDAAFFGIPNTFAIVLWAMKHLNHMLEDRVKWSEYIWSDWLASVFALLLCLVILSVTYFPQWLIKCSTLANVYFQVAALVPQMMLCAFLFRRSCSPWPKAKMLNDD